MLVCALTLLAIALQEKREGLRRALPWLLMAAAFCALSLDEIATLHEGLSAALAARIDNSGLFYFAWTLPALALCLAGRIGRASGRERVCQDGEFWGVAVH